MADTKDLDTTIEKTQFVDYTDSAKSYDLAREPLGVDVILNAFSSGNTGTPLAQQKVLDGGCGTGNYISEMVDSVGEVWGYDLSEAMLEKARVKFADNAKVKDLVQASCMDLVGIYEDNTFDGIVINQTVQHIEDDETRPTRSAMAPTFKECSRILKPGGVCVISTRSKEPQYSDLYWYAILAPKAVAAMEIKVPSRDEIAKTMEAAGMTVQEAVCPKDKGVMRLDYFLDGDGPFNQSWRRGESWWSLVSEEELAEMLKFLDAKKKDGTIDAWIAERDLLRQKSGQVLFMSCVKGGGSPAADAGTTTTTVVTHPDGTTITVTTTK